MPGNLRNTRISSSIQEPIVSSFASICTPKIVEKESITKTQQSACTVTPRVAVPLALIVKLSQGGTRLVHPRGQSRRWQME